jgi:Leucine-rich repeat (LRR) protein
MNFLKRVFSAKQNADKEKAFDLGKTIDYRQIPKIKQFLEDKNAEVRRAAISSLEQQWPTGDAVGIMALTEKLQDLDADVRKTAALAIGEFIPCAKTPLAIQAGTEAIKKLLKVLETEQDEKVLESVFTSLANIDDPSIIPAFSEIARKIKISAIYAGIRNISLLRPTSTRKEMISILQSREVEVATSVEKSGGQEKGDYHGKMIETSNVEVLMELEKRIGAQIPIVTTVDARTFGAIIENGQVVELGLNHKGLDSIPENIGQLTALRVLWLTDNKIKALPESFGNLKSLKTLLMQWNEITSLPESIVNLDKLEFLRFDGEAETTVSTNVAKWLKKQEKKLGRSRFLHG